MKKIHKNEMAKINGGAKCIYHAFGLYFGLIGVALNAHSIYECWNNRHSE